MVVAVSQEREEIHLTIMTGKSIICWDEVGVPEFSIFIKDIRLEFNHG